MSHPNAVLQQLAQLLGLRSNRFDLEAGVDVFAVLAEDHHVDLLGRFTGDGTPWNQRTGRRQTYRSRI